jgi:hypothetical protein
VLRHERLLVLALFAGAALISGFTILQGIDPFDEGLMLQAASRIAHGQIPYRDFLWTYGPAQPYLLAGLAKLLGPSLLQWRIVRVLADASVALLAYLLVRRRAGLWLSLIVWLSIAGEMAEPRSANPFPMALVCALLALLFATAGEERSPPAVVWPAVLTAIAAGFRLDFGLYALIAVAVAVALAAGSSWRPALRFVAFSTALIALIYLPFAILDGPGSLYAALVGISLRTGSYWSLPFPLDFRGAAGAGLAQNFKHAVDFYVPLLLVLGFVAAVVGWLAMLRSDRRPAPLESGLVVFGAGALLYLLSRPDEFHATPLLVVVTILLGLLIARVRSVALGGRRGAGAACVAPLAVVLALLLFHGAANRISAAVRPPAMSTIHIPVADGVEAPPAEARAIERMVALVHAYDPSEEPIFVAARRSDLIRINAPLIYVLAARSNAYREDFGLETGAAAQEQIISALTAARPRVIVRWTDPTSSAEEPNLRGRPSGVHTLDAWIAAQYSLLARLYHYDVLVIRRS